MARQHQKNRHKICLEQLDQHGQDLIHGVERIAPPLQFMYAGR